MFPIEPDEIRTCRQANQAKLISKWCSHNGQRGEHLTGLCARHHLGCTKMSHAEVVQILQLWFWSLHTVSIAPPPFTCLANSWRHKNLLSDLRLRHVPNSRICSKSPGCPVSVHPKSWPLTNCLWAHADQGLLNVATRSLDILGLSKQQVGSCVMIRLEVQLGVVFSWS